MKPNQEPTERESGYFQSLEDMVDQGYKAFFKRRAIPLQPVSSSIIKSIAWDTDFSTFNGGRKAAHGNHA